MGANLSGSFLYLIQHLEDLIDAARFVGYEPPQEDTNDHAQIS